MYAENFNYYGNATGGGYHNRQVLITTASDGTLLQVTELITDYDDDIVEIYVNDNIENVINMIKSGDLEPVNPEQFIKLLMLVDCKIVLNQDLYELGYKLEA